MSRNSQTHGGIFTVPMDHNYRDGPQGNNGAKGQRGGRPGFAPSYKPSEPEPLPLREDAASRIFAFVDDLFFLAKIQETARKLNVKVEFVKTDKDLMDRMKENGDGKPSLIIFDLNNANAKPLTLIPKLKSKLKKETSIIVFLFQAANMLLWDYQNMGRRLRIDVLKRVCMSVFVNFFCGNLALDNAAKQTIIHGASSSSS